MPAFVRLLRRLISCGRLTVIDADGATHVFEGAPVEGLIPVTVKLHDRALHWKIALRPSLAKTFPISPLRPRAGSPRTIPGSAASAQLKNRWRL